MVIAVRSWRAIVTGAPWCGRCFGGRRGVWLRSHCAPAAAKPERTKLRFCQTRSPSNDSLSGVSGVSVKPLLDR